MLLYPILPLSIRSLILMKSRRKCALCQSSNGILYANFHEMGEASESVCETAGKLCPSLLMHMHSFSF